MEKNNRVLGRRGARELTPQEADHVTGGIRTHTICTLQDVLDGDARIGDCA